MAHRPSSIDRLDPEIRDAIGRLRDHGKTIDEILDHLRTLEIQVSRSALGRHVRGMEKMGEKLRRSRAVAEGLVRQLGDAPENKTSRLNIELLHSAILDLFMAGEDGDEEEDGKGVDGDGRAALQGNPMGVMMLAKALESLTRASKNDVDAIAAIEKRAAEKARRETLQQAAAKAEDQAKEAGLSAQAAAAIRREVLGLRPPAPPSPPA